MGFFKKWLTPNKKFRNSPETTSAALIPDEGDKTILKTKLKQNKSQLQNVFGNTVDFRIESIHIGNKEGLICFLESMTDAKTISEQIRQPLALASLRDRPVSNREEFESLRKDLFSGVAHQWTEYQHELVWNILSGYAVLIIEGLTQALAIQINGIETRSINEPTTQTIVRGPKDGFTESIGTNISLIRRRLKNPHLRFESYYIGKDSHTSISVAFIEGISNEKIVQEVRNRVMKIQTSAIFDSGSLEDFITDKTWTPFPTVYSTERPDTIAANLIEGKIAILVDGSPFVLLVPVGITDFFQVSEDYYQPFMMSTFIRWIRYLAFFISLILPAVFVSLITFHYELIPTPLLISIIAQREEVPFPAFVELLIMEITFEVLREAGARMPRAVGQALSIVGALVIGQAAVEAGIISNTMVIVVALTAISSFVSPVYSFSNAPRLIRFALVFLSALLGLYGLLLGLVVMVAHLASLRSFGIPYLAPVAPLIIEDQKDVFVRYPMWGMKTRPLFLNTKTPLKQPESTSPSPPPQKGGARS
jgi:spore germination protein KA